MRFSYGMVDIRHLVWEPEVDVAHIRDKHSVPQEEAEQVCFGKPVIRVSYAGRMMAIVVTGAGRMLAVVLDPESEAGAFYPVTTRPASRQERRLNREAKGATDT